MGVIGEEVARAELEKIEKHFCIELDGDQKKTILRGIMMGRLDFEPGDDVFTMQLVKPLELANGEEIKSIRLVEHSAEQLKEAFKPGRAELDATIHLISSITGQPIGVVSRMKSRDITLAGTVLSFFA